MLEENQIFSKIFMWMFIGLAITFGIGYYVSLNENMLYNVFKTYFWFLIIAEIVVVIWLSARIRKMSGTAAKFMFCLYSFLTGLTFSSIFVAYSLTSIIYVFGLAAIIFLIFAVIGYKTKMDLTKFGTYIFMALIGILLCSIVGLFIKSEAFNLGLTIVGLLVFIAYTAYDIQVIKRNLYGLEEDNLAIYGALQLYLDFINIFIKLLRLFGNSRD